MILVGGVLFVFAATIGACLAVHFVFKTASMAAVKMLIG